MQSKNIIIILWLCCFLACFIFLIRQTLWFNEVFSLSNALTAFGLLISSLALFFNIYKDDSDSKIEQIEKKIGQLSTFNIRNSKYDGVDSLENLERNLASKLVNGSFKLSETDFNYGIVLILENYTQLNDLLGFLKQNLGKKPSRTLIKKYKEYRNGILITLIDKINIYLDRFFENNRDNQGQIIASGIEEENLLRLYSYTCFLINRLK